MNISTKILMSVVLYFSQQCVAADDVSIENIVTSAIMSHKEKLCNKGHTPFGSGIVQGDDCVHYCFSTKITITEDADGCVGVVIYSGDDGTIIIKNKDGSMELSSIDGRFEKLLTDGTSMGRLPYEIVETLNAECSKCENGASWVKKGDTTTYSDGLIVISNSEITKVIFPKNYKGDVAELGHEEIWSRDEKTFEINS